VGAGGAGARRAFRRVRRDVLHVSPSHVVEEAEGRCRESLRAGQGHFFSVEAEEAGARCAFRRVRQRAVLSHVAEEAEARRQRYVRSEIRAAQQTLLLGGEAAEAESEEHLRHLEPEPSLVAAAEGQLKVFELLLRRQRLCRCGSVELVPCELEALRPLSSSRPIWNRRA
jgi:hypothetical protein